MPPTWPTSNINKKIPFLFRLILWSSWEEKTEAISHLEWVDLMLVSASWTIFYDFCIRPPTGSSKKTSPPARSGKADPPETFIFLLEFRFFFCPGINPGPNLGPSWARPLFRNLGISSQPAPAPLSRRGPCKTFIFGNRFFRLFFKHFFCFSWGIFYVRRPSGVPAHPIKNRLKKNRNSIRKM